MVLKTASLPDLILAVVENKGTERPFTGEYDDFGESGTYLCRRCGLALFRSQTKFHSGCGWPSFDEFNVYCAELLSEHALPPTIEAVPLRRALELVGTDWYTMAAKAYAIINWDKNHQYCGRCGNITVHKPGTFERICTVCSLNFYPRISPSVIVLIYKDDHILMARSPHFAPGAYGLIAGFVEAGESTEAAVYREAVRNGIPSLSIGINKRSL